MYRLFKFFLLVSILYSCGNKKTDESAELNDSIAEESVVDPEPEAFPDTAQASVKALKYDITVHDTLVSGKLSTLHDLYKDAPGRLTFRGGLKRDADFGGSVQGRPERIVQKWKFMTDVDLTETSHGTWGGGTGWTGQPLYIEWPDSIMERFKKESPALTNDFSNREIIVASLCGKVYFINFGSGTASRQTLDTTNPIKGTTSLDPSLNGNLYVGQGIPKVQPMGRLAYNLFSHTQTFFSGRDNNSWVGWQANDSSPVRVGEFLFWPSENGVIYKYLVEGNSIRLHTSLRWKPANGGAAGCENSLVVYHNYGFIGNNHGKIMCFELNTMQPIWYYDNHDDIDASMVLEEEEGVPYLYCGTEVDRQGNSGTAYFVKLNALNGALVWESKTPCTKLDLNGKHFDGGFYSTPLLGKGNCEDLIFANVCQREQSKAAEFTAFSKKTGDVVYRTQLKTWAWSSPVAFYNENNEMFIFAGDAYGYAYLIEGKTGEIIYSEHMVNNFESSPVVIGNELVVGSRGQEIYKFAIE